MRKIFFIWQVVCVGRAGHSQFLSSGKPFQHTFALVSSCATSCYGWLVWLFDPWVWIVLLYSNPTTCLSRQTHQEELQAIPNKGIIRGPKPVEGDIQGAHRPRRQSAPWSGPPDVSNPNWDPTGGGNKPIPPAATTAALKLPNKVNGSPRGSLVSSLDEAVVVKSISAPGEVYILEVWNASWYVFLSLNDLKLMPWTTIMSS